MLYKCATQQLINSITKAGYIKWQKQYKRLKKK